MTPSPDGTATCPECQTVVNITDPGSTEAAMPAPAVPPIPPDVSVPFSPDFLKKYRPVGFLGKGAMGVVFLMQQIGLERYVAVKVVKAEVLTEGERRRLQKEAKILASLDHPNILTIFDGTCRRQRASHARRGPADR